MTPEVTYLMDVRLLGKNESSCVYYTGPTADCPPLPKPGEQVDCGNVTGRVTALIHEREMFPGYVVFHLDIFTDMSENEEDMTALNGRLQVSSRSRLKDLFTFLLTGLSLSKSLLMLNTIIKS